jgi:hypothetical protein
VRCDGCAATSDEKHDSAEVIAAWNTRAGEKP